MSANSLPKRKSPSLFQRYINYNLLEKTDLAESMKAFAITNTFFYLGLAVAALLGEIDPILIDLNSLDFGLLFALENWLLILESTTLLGSVFTGWIVASIWAKHKNGSKYGKIIILATQIPVILLLIFGIILSLMFSLILGVAGLVLIFAIVQLTFILSILSMLLAVVGLLAAYFVGSDSKLSSKFDLDQQYLILNVVPPTQGEKKELCPFSMKDSRGCAFLGYEASNTIDLICDYKSTWLRCTVYAHIYNTIKEGNNAD